MHHRTSLLTKKHPLSRQGGKPRLAVRRRPIAKPRRVIPGRMNFVSAFCVFPMPTNATEHLRPEAKAALTAWLNTHCMHSQVKHKGHHFTLSLYPVALSDELLSVLTADLVPT